MKIDVEQKTGYCVVRPHGSITGEDSHQFLDTVLKQLESDHPRVVLDISQVTFVSSVGLGDMVRIVTQANSQSGKVILASPAPFVDDVLKTTRLDRFFDVVPTVAEAATKITK